MKKFLLIIYLLFGLISIGQLIPENYSVYTTLELPKELKRNGPTDLMFDNQEKHLAISYGYNPSHVYIYETSNFEIVQKLNVKGFTYFETSYFGTTKSGKIYIDYGRYRSKYIVGDLRTGEIKKIDCFKSPEGCDFSFAQKKALSQESNLTYNAGDNCIISIIGEEFEIYRQNSNE